MAKPNAHPRVVLDLRKRLAIVAEQGDMNRLAQAAGVSYHTLIKIHNGQSPNPTVETFCRIENALKGWTPKPGFNVKKPSKSARPSSALLATGA